MAEYREARFCQLKTEVPREDCGISRVLNLGFCVASLVINPSSKLTTSRVDVCILRQVSHWA